MNRNESGFRITYSASEREAIKEIKDKYVRKEVTPIERLRKLDRRVVARSEVAALVLGIVGMLVFGFGLSAVLAFGGGWVAPGIIIGVVGAVIASLAYPAYLYVMKREKAKVADEIIRLCDEVIG